MTEMIAFGAGVIVGGAAMFAFLAALFAGLFK